LDYCFVVVVVVVVVVALKFSQSQGAKFCVGKPPFFRWSMAFFLLVFADPNGCRRRLQVEIFSS